jgi:phosphatidate cytidylyltransferase
LILLAIVFACMYLDVAYPLSNIPGLWMIPFFAVLALGTVNEACRIAEKAWDTQAKLSPMIVLVAIFLPTYPEFAQLYKNTTANRTSHLTEISNSSVQSQESASTNSSIQNLQTNIPQSKNNTWTRLGVTLTGTWLLAAWMGLQTMLRYQSPKDALGWLLSCGLLLYLCVPFACWWIDRQIGDQRTAMLRIIGIALVAKMSDVGAYFVGKSIGKHKLVPVLSPKKTWEGFLGGVLAACIASEAFFSTFIPRHTAPLNLQSLQGLQAFLGPIGLGCLLAIGGLFGDLIESMLKRSGDVKDSGSTLPGLGGIWDVTDSLIPAGIIGLLAIEWGWI